MKPLIISLMLCIMAGCTDEVVTHFKTLDEAKKQMAFGRGWLPPWMPASAVCIEERNNLDLNNGTGSFEYDYRERIVYIEKLQQAGGILQPGQNRDVLILSTNGSTWKITLSRTEGKAQYETKFIRP